MCMYSPEVVDHKAVFENEKEYSESLQSFKEFSKNGWRFKLAESNEEDFSVLLNVYEDVAVEDGVIEAMVHDGPEFTKDYFVKAFVHKPKVIERTREGKEPEIVEL